MLDSILFTLTHTEPVVWIAALAGVVCVLAIWAASRALFPQADPIFERLQGGDGARARAMPTPSLVARNLKREQVAGARERSQVYRLLIHAGYRDDRAPTYFMATKFALAVSFPALAFVIWSVVSRAVDFPLWLALGSCAAGFFLPNLWLYSKVRDRQKAIERALPDFLDLLVTCVEAGLGLDASILRVAEEQELSAPVLSSETRMTFLEIQAGVQRTDAFRRLAERTGVTDLKSLAATLNQTELFGTSVATALRVQSEWIRTRRMQLAEERAATVAVKMTLPLVLFILPSLLCVIMGPAVLSIATNLLPHFD